MRNEDGVLSRARRLLHFSFLSVIISASAPAMASGMPTYLALGDSYTIGEAVPESARWPMQLAAALRARGIGLADPRIVATTGWTTDELAAAMDAADLAPV